MFSRFESMLNYKAQMSNEVQRPIDKKKYDLEERTAKFGANVIEFVKNLQRNKFNRSLINQVIRFSTSIGANYMEADGAESKRDFQYKITLCTREAKETKHWLRMIATANPNRSDECRILWIEAQEPTLIFSYILRPKRPLTLAC